MLPCTQLVPDVFIQATPVIMDAFTHEEQVFQPLWGNEAAWGNQDPTYRQPGLVPPMSYGQPAQVQGTFPSLE